MVARLVVGAACFVPPPEQPATRSAALATHAPKMRLFASITLKYDAAAKGKGDVCGPGDGPIVGARE